MNAELQRTIDEVAVAPCNCLPALFMHPTVYKDMVSWGLIKGGKVTESVPGTPGIGPGIPAGTPVFETKTLDGKDLQADSISHEARSPD